MKNHQDSKEYFSVWKGSGHCEIGYLVGNLWRSNGNILVREKPDFWKYVDYPDER